MTREELQSMGLSTEEIDTILATQGESTGAGLPAPLLKISYDAGEPTYGHWVMNEEKDENGIVTSCDDLGESIDLIIFANKAQYSKYDAEKGTTTVASNIFDTYDAKSAVDSKSGMLISDLKKTDDKIKWANILIGLVRKTGTKEWTPCITYARGAWGYAFNQLGNSLENSGKYNTIFTLKTKKAKQGAVTYFTLDEKASKTAPIPEKEKGEIIKMSLPIAKAYNDWVAKINSQGSKPTTNSSTNVEEIDEDDLVL